MCVCVCLRKLSTNLNFMQLQKALAILEINAPFYSFVTVACHVNCSWNHLLNALGLKHTLHIKSCCEMMKMVKQSCLKTLKRGTAD